jgi:acetyl-CoA acetyltransferase
MDVDLGSQSYEVIGTDSDSVAILSDSVLHEEPRIDTTRLNPHGGAIAIGHPLGMSGTRVALHLALELRRRGGGTGAAALCGGGGQGSALVLSV